MNEIRVLVKEVSERSLTTFTMTHRRKWAPVRHQINHLLILDSPTLELHDLDLGDA